MSIEYTFHTTKVQGGWIIESDLLPGGYRRIVTKASQLKAEFKNWLDILENVDTIDTEVLNENA